MFGSFLFQFIFIQTLFKFSAGSDLRGFTVGKLTSIFVDIDYNDSYIDYIDHLQFTRAAIFRLHFLMVDGNVREAQQFSF